MRAVPTTKPSRKLYYSEEQLRRLLAIWQELRNPGRRRQPGYIGQRLTFNRWLASMTVDGAERALAALAAAEGAPTSGTVERPMKTPTKTPQKAKSTKTAKAAKPPPARARPGRKSKGARARTTMNLPLGLKDRVKKACGLMAAMNEEAPPDLTAFAVAAMEEKISAVQSRYFARKTPK